MLFRNCDLSVTDIINVSRTVCFYKLIKYALRCESQQLADYLVKLKCLSDAYSWWQHLHVTYQEMPL